MKPFVHKNQNGLADFFAGAEPTLPLFSDRCYNADGENAGGTGTRKTSNPDNRNPQNADDNEEDPDNNNSGSRYPDSSRSGTDPGTGAGGADYVGRNTGVQIDDSISDTVSGGSVSVRSGKGAGADDAVPDPASTGLSRMGAGHEVESSMNDAESRRSNQEVNTDQGRFAGQGGDGNQPIQDADETGGTGSGAAMNDHGSRIHDIPAGTGSAQRGNRAGMEDEDDGTITGGTAPYTGMGDSGTAQGRKLYDHEKDQRKKEE